MTKIAILTGASSGIGRAIDERLLSEGWRAVRLNHHITGKQPDEYKIDLNDLTATAQLGKQLASELEHIDAFIHVAGIWHDAHEVLAGKKLADFMPTQIAESMNVGVTSAMVLCNALLPRIQSGTVIGISGTFADGAAGWLPYYTSKRALEDFLLGLSQDYSELKVYGISPADTATPAYQKFYPQYVTEAQLPKAIAGAAWELLSGANEFRSGEIIEVRQGVVCKSFHTDGSTGSVWEEA